MVAVVALVAVVAVVATSTTQEYQETVLVNQFRTTCNEHSGSETAGVKR